MSDYSFQDNTDQKYEVTPLELFFDLVFVFAVSQLSHYLLIHLSWRGGAETLVMLIAIFAAWFTTSWSATIIRADELRTRWLMLTVMFLGLFMNASVTRAFTTFGWAFVTPLLLIMLGRTVWTIVNAPNAVFRDHYVRTLIWLIVTTPLWIAGATVGAEERLLCWASAAGIDQVGRWLAHPIPGRRLRSENVEFDATHMLERCRLFLLIALGETVFTTGTAIAAAPTTLMTLVTGTFALVGTLALWSMTVGRSHRFIVRQVKETSDPIHAARRAVDALLAMVAGLIAMAVANEEVIASPQGRTSFALSLLLVGGPVLFLVAQGWYLWVVPKVRPRLHMIGGVALLMVGLVTLAVQPFIALFLVGTCLATLAVLDR
jgi:low temperature requirement protein LtrA